MEVNIRGLRSNIGELSNLCLEKKPTIVIAVETFLDSTVQDGADFISIPGYTMCCRRDRTGTSGGGIAVYSLEGVAIHHDPQRDPKDLELMWLSVSLQSKKLLIGALYRPPSANNDIIEYLDTNTIPKIEEFGAHSVMLVGDFNVHHEDWLGSRNTDSAGRRMLQIASGLGLDQIVNQPTRGDQILDLVLTDIPASSSTLANVGTSDHNPVLVKLDVAAFRDKPYQRRVWQYDKANYWEMRGYFTSVNWSGVFQEKDPERACNRVTEIITDAMDLYIPNKTVTKKPGDKAWFNDECRKAAKKKRRIFKELKKHGTDSNKENFTKARKSYNKVEKEAKKNYDSKLKEDLTDNNLSSKKWWRVVNLLSGRAGHCDIPVIAHDGEAHTTAREKSDVFCKTFAEKCHLPDADDLAPNLDQSTTASIDSITFKPKAVHRLLKQLSPDKATGPDEIPARILKECSAELASPLCRLFHLCFSQGVFPSQWKTARVTPIHKRDSKSDPTKYRPISLLSIISKVMEAAVNQQLQSYFFQNSLISHRQFGFRPGHSTGDLLTILSQKWNDTLDKGEEVCAVALDIKGAFDKVWHNGLLAKLTSKGVCGKLSTWLRSYLSDRSLKVVLSGQASEVSSINASVPQGSILGPLLFSVYIDDLVDVCENELYLYADDSTLYAPIPSPQASEDVAASLNRDLTRMKSWADTWKVTFEPSKCKVMTFSRKRSPSELNLYLGDCQLAAKHELEILGVTFDSKLTWSKHILAITTRAGQKLGALRKVANKLDCKGRATVYKAQVRSVMEYASLCWTNASPSTLSLLDNVQKKALKIIGVDDTTARTQLSIPSLAHRRQVAAVSVLYKMHSQHCPKDLGDMLPPSLERRRMTRLSASMPDHALALPDAKTSSLDRSFIHSAVRIWNSLPDSVVGNISITGLQAFKSRVHVYLLSNV